MSYNASENESKKVKDLELKRVRDHFSTPREQWQNVAAESAIRLGMRMSEQPE
jgi:hypothetical protein